MATSLVALCSTKAVFDTVSISTGYNFAALIVYPSSLHKSRHQVTRLVQFGRRA